jgi:hypothetical protein
MKNLLLCFTLLVSLFSKAQTKDTTLFYLNNAATGNWNQTNTSNTFLFNDVLKFNLKRKKFAINTTNGYLYGKHSDLLSNNDYSSSLDFNIFKTVHSIYYWGLANYDNSYSLNIVGRLQTGAGIGYSIWNKPDFVLSISDGFLYEYGHFENTEPYQTVRNSLRLKYKVLVKTFLTWEGNHFYQPSLSDFDDYVIKSNSTLSIKLYKWFNLTSAVAYNKLNHTGAENFLFTFGINVEKYF